MIGSGGLLYGIGETYRGRFSTFNSSGTQADADSTPTGTLVANGTDTGVTVTVTSAGAGTGRYTVTCSLSGRSVGDDCHIRISATVGGTTQVDALPSFRVVFAAAMTTSMITRGTGADQLDVSGGAVTLGTRAQNFFNRGRDNWFCSGTTSTYDPVGPTLTFTVTSGLAISQVPVGAYIQWKSGNDVLVIRQITNISGTTVTINAPIGDLAEGELADIISAKIVQLATQQPNYAPATSDQAGAIQTTVNDISATVETINTNVGTAGAGLTAAPDTPGIGTLLSRLTAARAGYIDNLNVGGSVASHADVISVNQSASKHLLLVTVGQYAPGETYTIEMRTFSAADGSAVNADTTPTLTATGNVSGSLSVNLSAATNPATGTYRWTYTPGATPTLEQIRLDGSATISSATFTLSAYSQTVDQPSVVWTTTDQSHLTSIFNKLPVNNLADETLVIAAIGSPVQTGATAVLAASQPNYAPAKAGDPMALTSAYDPAKNAASEANATTNKNAVLSAIAGINGSTGPGADHCTLNFKENSTPIADADVWISTDSAGSNVIAGTLQTDSSGNVTFLLDAGNPYYCWMQKDGVNPIKGKLFTATAD